MKRYFLFQNETSDKFWDISVDGCILTVHFGRSQTQGQVKSKTFATAEECLRESQKLIAEKVGKGYWETAESNFKPKEILLKEIGGTTPCLRFEGERTYLLVDMPFFLDENDNELDGDEDFPEGACFEDLLSQYLGISVEREDREVFYMEDATKSQIDKLIYLMENYWILRDEFVRTYSEALYQEVLAVRKRLNGPEGD